MKTISEVKSQGKVLTQATTGRFVLGLLLSVLSGVILLLAFPPYGIWWLAWFAFAPGIFAQFRLFPVKYSSLAPAIYLLVWFGPYLARLFGTQFGPFFTYLDVLVGILAFLTYRERAFIERTGYRWLIFQGIVAWVGFEMVRATFIPVIATSAFIAGSEMVLVADVSLGSGNGTLYTSLGDVLSWVTLAGLVGFIIYQVVEGRMTKKEAKSKVGVTISEV
jgi:hypothetical protein